MTVPDAEPTVVPPPPALPEDAVPVGERAGAGALLLGLLGAVLIIRGLADIAGLVNILGIDWGQILAARNALGLADVMLDAARTLLVGPATVLAGVYLARRHNRARSAAVVLWLVRGGMVVASSGISLARLPALSDPAPVYASIAINGLLALASSLVYAYALAHPVARDACRR